MVEIIRFQNYSFKYSNSQEISLNNVNLSIDKGDFALMIGDTGSGKSTLLKQLKPELALGKVTGGKLSIFGEWPREQFSDIAYISQFVDNQMVTESARDEFHFVLENQGLNNEQIHSKIAEIASYFDITDLMDLGENDLSGGQKQLINLASALILNPQILLLDEPTSQLDPVTSEKFMRMIQKINQDLNITVLLVEHTIEHAVFYANRLIVIDSGTIKMNETVDVGLGKLFDEVDLRNYLPQIDRFYLEQGMDIHEKLPLTNQELNKLIQNKRNEFYYHESREISDEQSKSILDVHNISFQFDFNERNIVDSVSFQLDKGVAYGILGPNGVGKTTLLRLMTKQLKLQSGSVKLNGTKLNKLGNDFYQDVFVLPQDPSLLFVADTVHDEISYQLEQENISYDENKITTILADYELDKVSNKSPYDLSGGQQEYLALAIGFIKNPQILFLDEPSKGLDPNMKVKLAEKLNKFRANGGTIFVNTHDVLFASKYLDYVSLMFDGKLSEFEHPREFFPDKYFYTTEINKAVREFYPQALLWEDINQNES
ncbi:ABC transporter ATP-binding protein [Companilactobacillus mishanensis]|uniref:ATP-binding cassette domain-containing protein n=1 Tax=Companilactobacillus mishanensis TaxID=2486008 RepID=A0A5P0ZGB6_9LACO|nr:ATP-binding cassette domain-containing protein [Companilactobacillus mishanensis]MQS52058.1 ATP-binding cassette domain-containing protein [Companilactobacillus mishanensis]